MTKICQVDYYKIFVKTSSYREEILVKSRIFVNGLSTLCRGLYEGESVDFYLILRGQGAFDSYII